MTRTSPCNRRRVTAPARPSTRCRTRSLHRRRRRLRRPSACFGPDACGRKQTDQQSSARFDACMPFIFKAEGGYSDTPGDSGGPTNFGITLATLKAYDGNQALTADDVKKLAPATATEIYRTAYWNRMQCGALPAGLDLEVFDFGVNSGPAESVKTLQKIVGVTPDGSIGPITLAAVGQLNAADLVARFAQARLGVLQGPEQARIRTGLDDAGRSNPDCGGEDARSLASRIRRQRAAGRARRGRGRRWPAACRPAAGLVTRPIERDALGLRRPTGNGKGDNSLQKIRSQAKLAP